MKQITRRGGFTIIEVMLFFGVASFLTIIMLVGTETALSQQKYKDSLTSLQSFLQMQYTHTTSVENDREALATCKNPAFINLPEGDNTPRGMSECVVVGRYISTNADATAVYAANVIALKPVGTPTQKNELDELNQYIVKTVDPESTATDAAFRVDREDINWGAGLVAPTPTGMQPSSNPAPFTLLIIRSPISGSIMTYHSNQRSAAVKDLIAPKSATQNAAQPLTLCVRPSVRNSLKIIEPARMGVRINAYATNQSAVEIPSEKDAVCDKA